jgi:hypothetical protein
MKRLLLCSVVILLLAAGAQETAPAGFEQWTPASLKHLESKMHADATADPHRFAVQLLADFPNDSAMLVHREADGPPEWHETQVDVFFVQAGSATLVLGGTLVNGETVGPHEKRNGTIQGGVRRGFPRETWFVFLPGCHISSCWRARANSITLWLK